MALPSLSVFAVCPPPNRPAVQLVALGSYYGVASLPDLVTEILCWENTTCYDKQNTRDVCGLR